MTPTVVLGVILSLVSWSLLGILGVWTAIGNAGAFAGGFLLWFLCFAVAVVVTGRRP